MYVTLPAVVTLLIGKTKSVVVKRKHNAITSKTLISSLITSTTDPVKKNLIPQSTNDSKEEICNF